MNPSLHHYSISVERDALVRRQIHAHPRHPGELEPGRSTRTARPRLSVRIRSVLRPAGPSAAA